MKALHSRRRRLWFRLALVAILAAAAAGAVVRREAIARECAMFLRAAIRDQTGLEMRARRISPRGLNGLVIDGFELSKAGEADPAFKAERFEIRYRFLDFISKTFESNFQITLVRPRLRTAGFEGLQGRGFPFADALRAWALAHRSHLAVRIVDGTLITPMFRVDGVRADVRNGRITASVPIAHMPTGICDLTTTLEVDGRYYASEDPRGDAIGGTLSTGGTVLDWRPLPHESSFTFYMSTRSFRVRSLDFLDGIDFEAEVANGEPEPVIDLTLRAARYPLAKLEPFLGATNYGFVLPRLVDADLHLSGPMNSPSVRLALRLEEGWIGKRGFRVLDIYGEGVYPTLLLSASGITLQDGTVMRLADKPVEVRELLQPKTFERLISEAGQDRVVFGDWELTRGVKSGRGDDEDFRMGRMLGPTNVYVSKRDDPGAFPEEGRPREENEKYELGLEYRLRSRDALKMTARDGEEFVGVERKMSF